MQNGTVEQENGHVYMYVHVFGLLRYHTLVKYQQFPFIFWFDDLFLYSTMQILDSKML